MRHKRWIAVGVVAVVALAVVLSANELVRRGIENAAHDALGTPTSVSGVSLGLASGRLGVHGVQVDNPESYGGGSLMLLGEGRLSAGIASVFADTVHVEEFVLRDVDLVLSLEDGASNVRPVLDRLRARADDNADDEGKRLVVDELRIEDVRVRVSASSPRLGLDEDLAFRVPTIRLEGVGAGDGATTEQIVSIVVTRVVHAAATSDEVPQPLRALLSDDLDALVADQRSLIEDAVRDAGESLLDDARDELDEALGG